MTCIDFILKVAFSQHHKQSGELAYEYRQNGFLSGHGLLSTAPIQNMRRPLQRRQSNKITYMPRSVSIYGLRTINVPRKSARSDYLPASGSTHALSHGHSQYTSQKHSGRCKRQTRLAYLRRLCRHPDSTSKKAVCGDSAAGRPGCLSVCVGLNRHRPLHEHVPMGEVQKHKKRSQNAYTAQHTRRYPPEISPGDIPEFIHISDGKLADREALDYIPIAPATFTIMDRGYVDYARLHRFERNKAFFIVRAKKNLTFRRRYSAQADKATGVLCDQTIMLTSYYPARDYPSALRRIRYFDSEQNRRFVFLTNNFELPALTIADLYRSRWRVELFFKWIKQHLRIKTFYGTDENAVKTQIWIAVTTYLLVAIMKKELGLEQSMYEILQILSITILHKMPVLQAFADFKRIENNNRPAKQLILFEI